ncbi:Myotubularin-related protein 14 [Varanus komodoensis]|nr:Myotubularin-related protein 14 [Varanus komodoensis]
MMDGKACSIKVRVCACVCVRVRLPCIFTRWKGSQLATRLVTLTERESRLEEVRLAFLAAYNSTVGLKSVSPSPSGAIGGLLEQFARGVGLRGSSAL